MTGGVKLDLSKFMKRRSEDRKIKCTICTKVYKIKWMERKVRKEEGWIYKLNIKFMFSFHIATPSTQCNIQRHKRYLRNYELITWQSSTSAAAPSTLRHLVPVSSVHTIDADHSLEHFQPAPKLSGPKCVSFIHWSQVKSEWHHVSIYSLDSHSA